MAKPIIAVVGATGRQGRSVCAAFRRSGAWKVRALTRNPAGAVARRYAAEGIEVVKANFENKASLVKAFRGATAVYAMSIPPWEAGPPNTLSELEQGTNEADAAKTAGVRFVLWATLPYVGPVFRGLGGIVLHDNKAMVNEYIRAIGLPAVFLSLAPFVEFFIDLPLIRWSDDWTRLETCNYVIDGAFPMLWTEHDLGPVALAFADAFHSHGASLATHPLNHTTQPVASFRSSYADISRCAGQALGVPAVHTVIPSLEDHWPGQWHPDLAKALAFINANGFYPDVATFPRAELVRMGVAFGTMEGFVQQKVVPIYRRPAPPGEATATT